MTESTHVLQRSLPAVLLALVVSVPDPIVRAGVGTGRASDHPPPGADARVERAFSLIERAFLRGEADLLAPTLSRRVKIFLSVPLLRVPDGYYGADQVVVLLRRAFAGRSTVRFVSLPRAPRPRPGGQVVLAARWSSRDEGSVEAEHRLSFVLAPENDALTVREIRELK